MQSRAEWREGFEAGLKVGALRYFQSPLMVQLAAELALLRVLYPAVCDESERRQREMASLNRIKFDALMRCVELARKLDELAPGWDKR